MASICLGLNVLRGVNKRWSFPVMTLCYNNRYIRTITLTSITVSQCSFTNESYFSPITRIRAVPGGWPRLQVNALSDNDISNTKRQVGVRRLLRDPSFPQMLNASLILGDDTRKRYFWNEKIYRFQLKILKLVYMIIAYMISALLSNRLYIEHR